MRTIVRAIFKLVRNLGLGLLLIGLAAGVLLYSDLGSRERQRAVVRQTQESEMLQIAVVQHASQDPLDDGVRGILDGLEARGHAEGDRLRIRRYNAEADMATANAIAREVISQDFDLIVSVSTPSLQTIANANSTLSSPRRHVFGISSDPYGAGVGISREDHFDHPPYMTGIGSMPPVEDAFRLMLELNPAARSIGLVWNPAEANSVAATELARRVTAELGLELVEANADNATAAGEAAASLTSRGIDALWISPDITTITAAPVLIDIATHARVPAFTSVPGHAEQGALFDVGGDYYQIGVLEGQLAADILDGTEPSAIPVENIMPLELHVNTLAIEGLRDSWVVSEAVRDRAQVLIDDDGRHVRKPVTQTADAEIPQELLDRSDQIVQ